MGKMLSRDEVQEICGVLARHPDILVLADEINGACEKSAQCLRLVLIPANISRQQDLFIGQSAK